MDDSAPTDADDEANRDATGGDDRLTRVAAAERARVKLLDVGRAMVAEQPVSAGLDHIRVTDVARRAGMTTGAIYHHWESQDAYRSELMEQLLAPIELQDSELLREVLELVVTGEMSVAELISLVAWDDLTQLSTDERFSIQMGFWSRRADPEVAERLQRAYRTLHDRRVELFSQFLEAFSLRMKPPKTVEDLVVTLTAVSEGLAIRRAIDPEAVPIGFPELSSDPAVVARLRTISRGRYPEVPEPAGSGRNPLADVGAMLIENWAEPLP